jgi:predicted aspartyl protease
MLGSFENGQPSIEIEVKGVAGIPKKIKAIVDSGFNGYLQLPFVEAFPLGLVLAGVQGSTLADGSVPNHLVCKGEVCIDGKCVDTTIDIKAANIILVGTQLLKELKKIFILDCSAGHVEIVDSGKGFSSVAKGK